MYTELNVTETSVISQDIHFSDICYVNLRGIYLGRILRRKKSDASLAAGLEKGYATSVGHLGESKSGKNTSDNDCCEHLKILHKSHKGT